MCIRPLKSSTKLEGMYIGIILQVYFIHPGRTKRSKVTFVIKSSLSLCKVNSVYPCIPSLLSMVRSYSEMVIMFSSFMGKDSQVTNLNKKTL